MSWIEFHQALPTHRKTYAVAAILRVKRAAVCGHMAMLWCWALDNAPSGDVSEINASVLAHAADWTGNANAFVSALIAAGFIDDVAGALTLHDWDDYAGKLLRARAAHRERSVRARSAHRAVLPNRTVQNSTAAAAAAAVEDDLPPTTFDGSDPATRCYRAFMDQSPGGFNGTIRDHIDGLLEGGLAPEVIEEACRISAEEGGNKGWAFVSAVIRRLSSGQSRKKVNGRDGTSFVSGLDIVPNTGLRLVSEDEL